MNFCIILHPTQNLELVEMQRKIIKSVNIQQSQNVLYPVYPLWLQIDKEVLLKEGIYSPKDDEEQLLNYKPFLKKIKDSISKLTIFKATTDSEGLIFPFSFVLNKTEYKGNLRAGIFANTTKANNSQVFESQKMDCKIFEIATAQSDGIQFSATETVWTKLK